VRRDFLEGGRAFCELNQWACKERIGTLYQLNGLRLAQCEPERPVDEQCDALDRHHAALQAQFQRLHEEAIRMAAQNQQGAHSDSASSAPGGDLSTSATKKVLASLLEHSSGLTLFVKHPEVPMDNNRAENTIRTPVNGRKNDYGSGSTWSAQLAAMLFSILQTLALWGTNPRHWLTCYLSACAGDGASATQDIGPLLPWSMDETRRTVLSRPYSSQAPPLSHTQMLPIEESACVIATAGATSAPMRSR
jgi:transposase